MNITKTTMYKTNDGAYFDSLHDAKMHQTSLDFESWYNDGNELISRYSSRDVAVDDFIIYVREHWSRIKDLIEVTEDAGN